MTKVVRAEGVISRTAPSSSWKIAAEFATAVIFRRPFIVTWRRKTPIPPPGLRSVAIIFPSQDGSCAVRRGLSLCSLKL